jgi:hypothetical protein
MKTYLTISIIFIVCFGIWYYSSFNNKDNMVLPGLKIDKLEMRIDSLEKRIIVLENANYERAD